MAKKSRIILCAIIIGLAAIFASACSFFDNGGDGRRIANITSRRNADNTGTIIEITYEGDEYEPDRFEIADPEPGKKGAGIKEIESMQSEDGYSTILTIYYDDELDHIDEIILPNGVFIIGMETSTDPETNVVTLTMRFSDPKYDTTFELAPGKDGKDGDKIKRIYTDFDEKGDIKVHIVYTRYDENTGETKEEEETFIIPKGERGSGIYTFVFDENASMYDSNYYHFIITYDDGYEEEILLPRASGWLSGKGAPGASQGNVGDFYFDITGPKMYYKESSTTWEEVADFSNYSTKEHTITFYMDENTVATRIQIKHGNSFASTQGATVPTPERPGYKFLGWYTQYVDLEAGEELSPNSGHFTDLTVVTGDLKLYALWSRVD